MILNSEKCTVHSIHSRRGAKCFCVSKNSQKSSSCCSLGATIDLEGPVKAGGDQKIKKREKRSGNREIEGKRSYGESHQIIPEIFYLKANNLKGRKT